MVEKKRLIKIYAVIYCLSYYCTKTYILGTHASLQQSLASVAQSDACPTGDQDVSGFDPRRVLQCSFMDIDHEIFSKGHSLPFTDSGRAVDSFWQKNEHKYWLTLKTPRKTASENVVCLCRLLNILADFSNLFLHTGKQCGPWSDCS